jgi:predicted DCC family thiol-disulfide oxidoreductase YuxK
MNEKLNQISAETPRVFYDGSCGLCHHFVHFVLIRMKTPFIFSPLQGKTFSKLIETRNIQTVPDSIVVYDKKQNRLYFKAEAILYVLRSLGKGWKGLAMFLSCIPLCIANRGYDLIAKIRRAIFKKPSTDCPILPQSLRKFFAE